LPGELGAIVIDYHGWPGVAAQPFAVKTEMTVLSGASNWASKKFQMSSICYPS